MPRFNVLTYDPRNDSSVDADDYYSDPKLGPEEDNPGFDPNTSVIIIVDQGDCLCGCRQKPEGKDSLFRMGHDARYRGKLIRAHLTNTEVVVVGDTGNISGPAMTFAANLGWQDYLKMAEEKQAEPIRLKLERANKALVAKATGPQVGDKKLLKIGRWEYTGQVLAIYETQGTVLYEYVTKKGETKTVEMPREES